MRGAAAVMETAPAVFNNPRRSIAIDFGCPLRTALLKLSARFCLCRRPF